MLPDCCFVTMFGNIVRKLMLLNTHRRRWGISNLSTLVFSSSFGDVMKHLLYCTAYLPNNSSIKDSSVVILLRDMRLCQMQCSAHRV